MSALTNSTDLLQRIKGWQACCPALLLLLAPLPHCTAPWRTSPHPPNHTPTDNAPKEESTQVIGAHIYHAGVYVCRSAKEISV